MKANQALHTLFILRIGRHMPTTRAKPRSNTLLIFSLSHMDYSVVMKRLVALTMAILALAVGCTKSDDPVVKVKAEDSEMNAAIASAQASLTNFMAAFQNPQTNQHDYWRDDYWLSQSKVG
jgi:hypothetical protein